MKVPGRKGWEDNRVSGGKRFGAKSGASFCIAAKILTYFGACVSSAPLFSPPPAQVTSIEGHASLSLTRGGETARARLSFLFRVPQLGYIEIQDSLGRTSARLLLGEDRALLILPSEKVYWQAGQEEVLDKLLGFSLRLEEITVILQGRWSQLTSWDLKMDERQRVVEARRNSLRIEVRRFFGPTTLPQQMRLFQSGNRGSLRLLRLRFNQPLQGGVFDFSHLETKGYRACTWEEIERLLRNED